jgi:C_GCAxxG_C_C family probable redox protein
MTPTLRRPLIADGVRRGVHLDDRDSGNSVLAGPRREVVASGLTTSAGGRRISFTRVKWASPLEALVIEVGGVGLEAFMREAAGVSRAATNGGAMTIKTDPELDALVMKYARPNCAQTSFAAMHEALDLDADPKGFEQALTAYPGIGHTGETCGAVTGPLLAIGLALGPKDAADAEQTMKAGAAAHHFCAAVSGEFGSTRCGEVIEGFYGKRVDMTDPEQV